MPSTEDLIASWYKKIQREANELAARMNTPNSICEADMEEIADDFVKAAEEMRVFLSHRRDLASLRSRISLGAADL